MGEAVLTAVAAAKLSSNRRALNRQPSSGKGQVHCASSRVKGILN